MRSLVDARINRNLEVKTVKAFLFPPTQVAGVFNKTYYTLEAEISDLSVATIIPRIALAKDGQEISDPDNPTRVGNKIRPVSCELRVRLYMDSQDTIEGLGAGDRSSVQPYLFVGYNKTAKSWQELTDHQWGGTVDRFWRSAGKHQSMPTTDVPNSLIGEDGPFDGNRGTFLLGDLNTSILHPYHVRTPELIRPYGDAIGDIAGGYAGFAGNFLAQKEYTFKIPMPSVLTYSQGDDQFPTNTMPFLACGFTYMNGAEPSGQAPLRIEGVVTFKYTDA
ncbi:hypothetical protein ES703_119517 [subsurface metagenome]